MKTNLIEQFGEIIKPLTDESGVDSVAIVVSEWVNERIGVAKEVLQQEDKNASRTLSQSIALLPTVTGEGKIRIQIEANDYWDFVNSGVDGANLKRAITNSIGQKYTFKDKQPPKATIRQWMFDRSITTSEYFDKTGAKVIKPLITEQDRDGLAFAIAKGIKKNGQKSTPFMNIAFSETALNDLEKRILEVWQ